MIPPSRFPDKSAFDSTTATNDELDLKQQKVDTSRNTKLVIECAAGILPERVECCGPVVLESAS
jgi:hypothetical protein